MTIYLKDLFDTRDLSRAMGDGYIRRQEHPTWGLRILNYTEKAQYEGVWNEVTRQCRGLICSAFTGEVLARPFPKFFNWGQPQAPALNLDAPALVTDKMDGSLGILYPAPDGHAIATRGSFTSDQALHATRIWNTCYAHRVQVPEDMTLLFEIVYSANRIVLDYGDLDDLVLLGGVQISTGDIVGPDLLPWPGPSTQVFAAASLREALQMAPRENAEDLVVRLIGTGDMMKIKQEDYVALHRVLTQTTARTVWEFLVVNACAATITRPKHWGSRLGIAPARAAEILQVGPAWLDRLVADVPDEFHGWLRGMLDELHQQHTALAGELDAAFRRLRAEHGTDRRSFAAAACRHPHSGALFLLYDDRDITHHLWRCLYPPAHKPWATRSEDVA